MLDWWEGSIILRVVDRDDVPVCCEELSKDRVVRFANFTMLGDT